MAGDFGSYIDKEIRDQIAVRQNIRAQKNGAWTTGKNAELYSVDHQNVPWICLRSSVDAAVGEYEPGRKSATSPELSKKYVLCGGTLTSDDNGNLKIVQDGGLGAVGYGFSETFGYRPRPGITKVTVKTKDTFGCIMEATIDFLVWSVEDLEAIDKIYFKPGMSALLEWGHSVYVDNKNEPQFMSQAKLYSMVEFLKHDTFEDVDKNVQARREKFDGNYEAIFGYIINFNWSFNNEGSYTCQLKLISKGSVLEGLQVPAGVQVYINMPRRVSFEEAKAQLDNEVLDPQSYKERVEFLEQEYESGELSEEAWKSPYHLILYSILKQIENTKKVGEDTYTVSWNLGQSRVKDAIRYWGGILYSKSFWGDKPEGAIAYVTLDTFLQITNRILEIANVDFPKFAVRGTERYQEQGFVTFKEHFSLDAYRSVLPYRPVATDPNDPVGRDPKIKEDKYSGEGKLNQFLARINAYNTISQASGLNNNNCIADILIGVNFILDCVDQAIDKKAERYEIRGIVESVLVGVQKALGNINLFDIHINHETNTAVIVDRNCISHDAGEKDDFEIKVSGKSSVLTNVSIKSEVSVEMVNEMSIAATAPDDSLGGTKAIPSQVFWNEGCEDRHRPKGLLEYDPGTLINLGDPETYLGPKETTRPPFLPEQSDKIFLNSRAFLEKAGNLYGLFFNSKNTKPDEKIGIGEGQYKDGAFKIIQNDGEDLFQKCVNRDISNKGGTDTGTHFQSSMIPVKINLTMKGIGRFVVGTTFRVSSGMLPKKYRNWRHIITGVEHSIDSGGWFTSVQSTYYYPAGESDSGGNKRPEPCKFPDSETQQASVDQQVHTRSALIDLKDKKNTGTKKFFTKFWSEKTGEGGSCARFVADMAKSWVSGEILSYGSMTGNAGDELKVNGRWISTVALDLKKLGWEIVGGKAIDLTYNQLSSIILKFNGSIAGTVLVYYSENWPTKTETFQKHWTGGNPMFMHVQMRAPELAGCSYTGQEGKVTGKGWTTSDIINYGCIQAEKPDPQTDRWKLWVLKPPKLNDNWK